MDRPKAEEADVTLQPEARPPHHENLYKLVSIYIQYVFMHTCVGHMISYKLHGQVRDVHTKVFLSYRDG